MAELTSNSGTTFLPDGGSVGVEILTNTNWRFYLTDNNGTPEWLRFNGNVSEIFGSETQIVNVEATKNRTPAERCASGICESINEPSLTAWTGFYQGPGGSTEDGLRLTYVIRLRATSSLGSTDIRKLTVKMPSGVTVFEWALYGQQSPIHVYSNQTTTIIIEVKNNYVSTYVDTVSTNNYIVNLVGGNHVTIEPGNYGTCVIGFGYGYNENYEYNETTVHGVIVSDEGNNSFVFQPDKYISDDYFLLT